MRTHAASFRAGAAAASCDALGSVGAGCCCKDAVCEVRPPWQPHGQAVDRALEVRVIVCFVSLAHFLEVRSAGTATAEVRRVVCHHCTATQAVACMAGLGLLRGFCALGPGSAMPRERAEAPQARPSLGVQEVAANWRSSPARQSCTARAAVVPAVCTPHLAAKCRIQGRGQGIASASCTASVAECIVYLVAEQETVREKQVIASTRCKAGGAVCILCLVAERETPDGVQVIASASFSWAGPPGVWVVDAASDACQSRLCLCRTSGEIKLDLCFTIVAERIFDKLTMVPEALPPCTRSGLDKLACGDDAGR